MYSNVVDTRDFAYPSGPAQAPVPGRRFFVVEREGNEELFAAIGATSDETARAICPKVVTSNDLQQAAKEEIESRPYDAEGSFFPQSNWTTHGKDSPGYPQLAECLLAAAQRRPAQSKLFRTNTTFDNAVVAFIKKVPEADDVHDPCRDFLQENAITTKKKIQDFVHRETAKNLEDFYRVLRSAEYHDLADHIVNAYVVSENIAFTQKALFVMGLSEELSNHKEYGNEASVQSNSTDDDQKKKLDKERLELVTRLEETALKLAQDRSVSEPDRATVYTKILSLPNIIGPSASLIARLFIQKFYLYLTLNRFLTVVCYESRLELLQDRKLVF